jgi:hypothetical protein
MAWWECEEVFFNQPYQSMMKVLLAEKVREELELEGKERQVERGRSKKRRFTEKDVERIVFEDR